MIFLIVGIGIFIFFFLFILFFVLLFLLSNDENTPEQNIFLETNADILENFDTYLTYNQAYTLFKAKLGADISFIGLDAQYKILDEKSLEAFLKEDQTNLLPYISDSIDCDDYARILQGNVLKSASKHIVDNLEDEVESGIAFGTLYGDISLYGESPTPHAMNVAVVKEGDNNYRLLLIEPQTDQWLQPNNQSTYWVVIF